MQHALQVASLGGDAIGLVFHRPSPRSIALDIALEIRNKLPPFVTITALFLNESEDWVAQVVDTLKPDCLQFHGDEPPRFCAQWGRPFLKSIPMASTTDAVDYAGSYPTAQGFLLDSNVAGRQGGSGDTFDWSKIPTNFDFPLVLAGGLTPANVAAAIAEVKPWAVDVSSGVETSRGVKDAALINEFFHEVIRGDANA